MSTIEPCGGGAPVRVDVSLCDLCDGCNAICPTSAIRVRADSWSLIEDACISCGFCVTFCPVEALAMGVKKAGFAG
ncbi:4Fe-4S binding protein [Sphingomonas sp. DG1-23]|uniref:4Fe-4S binding protein n=1 Tax=Sphingomonas sp. DG1-23 TaxID=3068316 RepID=UPI00273F6094|nr:4Fe-4S binding protein [Sphingomonas sp. DG1-23]MDP5279853.1 4Fe-4S binding protein [Sphingomonas sp. DG1-23]